MPCDVFISYSRTDLALAERLERALTEKGFAVWRDKKEIRPGDDFTDEIAAALDSCYAVVWLASAASVQAIWVQRELAYAVEKQKLVIPVHLNRGAREQMPPKLRLLFTHIDYVDVEVRGWESGVADIVSSLHEVAASAAQLKPTEGPTRASFQSPKECDWPGPLGAVETPSGCDLLPITEQAPLMIGVAIDVSGSMQSAIQNDTGGQRTRLQGVLDAVRDLARCYRTMSDSSPEIAEGRELAKLFAYGFGFADRAAKHGKLAALAQRFLKDAPPVPARVFRGAVRDLLEVAELSPHTLLLREIDAQWPLIEQRLWDQRIDLFGSTEMREAMEMVNNRFTAEFAVYPGTPHSALFLVSDGESKDGSPLDACRKMAVRGTTILSCYLTSQDVAEPRRLYSRPQPHWPEGALTLFRCSSVLEEDSLLLPVLREKGWTANEGDRLFVQMNQSALVAEFISFVLALAPGGSGEP